MAITIIAPQDFDNIARGTSVTIPVLMRRLDGTPFDLTDFQAFFTMKEVQWDYDYEDARAAIHKEILIDNPEEGRFFIQLSSKETWQTPGSYHFDIELVKDGGVVRVGFFKTSIVGGPSNRNVNTAQTPLWMTDSIQITITGQQPIVLITPLISDPPKDLIETIIAEPKYLIEELDSPVRNIKIKSYAPRVSLVMSFYDLHDGAPHDYNFENFSFQNLPIDCPLKDGKITIDNRKIRLTLAENGPMKIWDSYIQHSPQITFDGNFEEISSDMPHFVGDNAQHGTLNMTIQYNPYKSIQISGNYYMPRNIGEFSHWAFRIDYFDWN